MEIYSKISTIYRQQSLYLYLYFGCVWCVFLQAHASCMCFYCETDHRSLHPNVFFFLDVPLYFKPFSDRKVCKKAVFNTVVKQDILCKTTISFSINETDKYLSIKYDKICKIHHFIMINLQSPINWRKELVNYKCLRVSGGYLS